MLSVVVVDDDVDDDDDNDDDDDDDDDDDEPTVVDGTVVDEAEIEDPFIVGVFTATASDCIKNDGGLYTTMICSSSWMIKGFMSDNDPDQGGNDDGIK